MSRGQIGGKGACRRGGRGSLRVEEVFLATASRKVFVIGLDCAPPELVFDKYKDDLPNLSRLMATGAWGDLESCHPPITVPAWSSMLSSRDPGQLGFYGFRNRADYSYDRMTIATSTAVKADRVWDILSAAGKEVVLVGVPQTFPVKPVNGVMVSSFLTPSIESQYTYPAALKEEIAGLVGEYMVDVRGFRTEDKDSLLKQIYEMTEKRFTVLKHLVQTRSWDFFMFVEMGTDRIHHGFWKYMDPSHPKHEAGNRYQEAIRDYYKVIDAGIGELLGCLDDDTVVLVISDHGAKKMDGGICFNEWLIREGYLVLKNKPEGIVPLEKCEVDWNRTKAWGSGGYYGRLFLNVEGREPQGIIPQSQYEAVRDELIAKLEAITDEKGKNIGTKALRPQDLYKETRNVPPDLIVYFGDLYWRSVGSIGLGSVYTYENDTGPDDANHAQNGIIIINDPSRSLGGRELAGLQLMDVAPTLLDMLGVDIPADMQGQRIAL